jgi:hypothetical protein
MNSRRIILPIFCALLFSASQAASPGDAPALPITGARIVNVASEPELQAAMRNLRNGDTILLADGAYNLTGHPTINGRNNVTIRGARGSTNVVLLGKGMDNRNHGGVIHGVWSNGTNSTIAHLTIRDTYDNPIIFNSPAQSPRVYCVRLINAGSQFIKSNPTDVNAGLGVNNGVVEYCWFEYTGNPPNDHGAGIGYFNGISAHAAGNWIVRGNLFKNLHNPDGSAYPWNPSVLFWRNSSNTVTEQNIFINVDRAIAYGLDNSVPYRDHTGGAIRNNFVSLAPGFLSPERKRSSDGSIIVWNSPETQVDHNTLLLNNNEFYAIEFRFANTRNATARNNLADAPIHLRDDAAAAMSGNLLTATAAFFVNPAAGDLHLLPAATNVINKAAPVNTVTNDFDGQLRPATNPDIGADEFTATERPQIIGFRLSGVEALLKFTSSSDAAYAIERTDILATPWTTVASNLLGTGSTVDFSDPNAAGSAHRFYRVRMSQ